MRASLVYYCKNDTSIFSPMSQTQNIRLSDAETGEILGDVSRLFVGDSYPADDILYSLFKKAINSARGGRSVYFTFLSKPLPSAPEVTQLDLPF